MSPLLTTAVPVLDGLEATRTIREQEKAQGRAPVHIIALTAHATPEDRAECLASGMDEFMTKPVRTHTRGYALDTCENGYAADCPRIWGYFCGAAEV